jgi:hypothetical protein
MNFADRPSPLRLCSLFLLAAISGCNGVHDDTPLVPVQGTVTLDDQPLSGADVLLIPVGETLGQGGIGRTDKAGQFELTTPDRKRKGAVKGSYRVVINKLVNPDGTEFLPAEGVDPMTAAFSETLPPIYSSMEQSQLTAQVPPGGAKLEFKLTVQAR